jgi:predicted nucleic acid-binding protein
MLVVADSSPLIVLVNIGHVGVLPALFGQVVVPVEVLDDLRSDRRPRAVIEFAAAPPAWLVQRRPTTVEAIPLLHAGERAAISLARELRADLLLIDDARGRRAAEQRQLAVTGTIGVLELAARRRLLDLGDAFERVKRTDFWVSPRLLDERLRMFRESAPGG